MNKIDDARRTATEARVLRETADALHTVRTNLCALPWSDTDALLTVNRLAHAIEAMADASEIKAQLAYENWRLELFKS